MKSGCDAKFDGLLGQPSEGHGEAEAPESGAVVDAGSGDQG